MRSSKTKDNYTVYTKNYSEKSRASLTKYVNPKKHCLNGQKKRKGIVGPMISSAIRAKYLFFKLINPNLIKLQKQKI